jgi:acetylornithine deacetylase/succinyl-diaminopimelate desuccinylase family protein
MSENNLSKFEKDVLGLIDQDEVVSLLQAIIQTRSDYPPGDCRAAIERILDALAQVGVPTKLYSKSDHQPNLLATYPPEAGGSKLLYHSHIDTVSIGDPQYWNFDPFAGEIHDGLVFGRGAGDDKSSVVAQIMAMMTLARAGVSLNGTLQVAVVSDEESGALQGTRWLRDDGILSPDVLVVGEQTNNQVAIAERVACGIDLTVYGKGTHGAMPWAGENAILIASSLLEWLKERLFPTLEERHHPYLPPPTLNIGKITGGIQWNIVPDKCKIEMDRRLIPGETREMAMQEIHQAIDEFCQQNGPIKYKLFSTGEVAANINTSPDEPFVALANQTLSDLTGEDRKLSGYVQTSDGRWFARDGIPIIIFGPSKPEVAHAVDEHVSISQLGEAIQFLTLLAMRWLG